MELPPAEIAQTVPSPSRCAVSSVSGHSCHGDGGTEEPSAGLLVGSDSQQRLGGEGQGRLCQDASDYCPCLLLRNGCFEEVGE